MFRCFCFFVFVFVCRLFPLLQCSQIHDWPRNVQQCQTMEETDCDFLLLLLRGTSGAQSVSMTGWKQRQIALVSRFEDLLNSHPVPCIFIFPHNPLSKSSWPSPQQPTPGNDKAVIIGHLGAVALTVHVGDQAEQLLNVRQGCSRCVAPRVIIVLQKGEPMCTQLWTQWMRPLLFISFLPFTLSAVMNGRLRAVLTGSCGPGPGTPVRVVRNSPWAFHMHHIRPPVSTARPRKLQEKSSYKSVRTSYQEVAAEELRELQWQDVSVQRNEVQLVLIHRYVTVHTLALQHLLTHVQLKMSKQNSKWTSNASNPKLTFCCIKIWTILFDLCAFNAKEVFIWCLLFLTRATFFCVCSLQVCFSASLKCERQQSNRTATSFVQAMLKFILDVSIKSEGKKISHKFRLCLSKQSIPVFVQSFSTVCSAWSLQCFLNYNQETNFLSPFSEQRESCTCARHRSWARCLSDLRRISSEPSQDEPCKSSCQTQRFLAQCLRY